MECTRALCRWNTRFQQSHLTMEVKMELATVRAMAKGTPCLYINQEFQRGEALVVLPPAPNAFALSQNNKEASFMDYSFSTYLMWHLNASSIASYFNSAQYAPLNRSRGLLTTSTRHSATVHHQVKVHIGPTLADHYWKNASHASQLGVGAYLQPYRTMDREEMTTNGHGYINTEYITKDVLCFFQDDPL
ncbi:uncharacterized protein [Miscanthus floridulus]|uniref:uncharacterized protein isoform X2 n=1 Tax=Miscanthus floridulus TaxID=154761 RepID=UPI00345914B8